MCAKKRPEIRCKEDENIRRSLAEASPPPSREQRQEVAKAEDNSGVEGSDKRGEQ
jgi:hypothetical protein